METPPTTGGERVGRKEQKVWYKQSIGYGVTVNLSRFHREAPGSTPGIRTMLRLVRITFLPSVKKLRRSNGRARGSLPWYGLVQVCREHHGGRRWVGAKET